MKLAIIGSGGREDAIKWKLSQSLPEQDIFVLPGNGGIHNSVDINITNFTEIKEFCEANYIELIIVGNETLLAGGISDFFANTHIKVLGPDKNASRLESSKIWAKNFMMKYGVDTANFWTFDNFHEAELLLRKIKGNAVIKYDGLAAGKGVFVCSSLEEAMESLKLIRQKYGDKARFLIEEKLTGREISIIGFTDGKDIKLLQASQDHKQLYEGDIGPNTGGMGVYCPVVFWNENLNDTIKEKIISPTLKGIQEERLNYKGIIYFGLIITNEGPKVLEYNVRLGDPEAQVILPSMKSDLLDLINACLNGTLKDYKMEFNQGYYIDVVLVSGGYPVNYTKGYEITGLERLSKDTLIFHSGTKLQNEKFVTDGGRVLNIVCNDIDLKDAIDKVYKECELVHFKDKHYRKDIGMRDL